MTVKKFLCIVAICSVSAGSAVFADAYESAVTASAGEYAPKELIPLGVASGIRLFSGGASVVGINPVDTGEGQKTPAREAGIKVGDVVTSLDGESIGSIDDVISFMDGFRGGELEVGFLRGDEAKRETITPRRTSDGAWKLGLTIRDSEAGIGTLTYLDPRTGEFGGLGHGIQDPGTGRLFDMKSGDASGVIITGIVKGSKDEPGEIMGMLLEGENQTGSVLLNTDRGVYGEMTPDSPLFGLSALKIASNDEITEGKAWILSDVLSNGVEKFEIEIEKVYNAKKNSNKNMLIRVTDERLLSATGGIIQGMSGSPIIQNGKLAGAVTHVLVHDPIRGYAISIENMFAGSPLYSDEAYAA
ncbi:MAG: SpoIVB peptidase [Clostridia bacterium]|nr:SpoIVB peptidase [Clostridia bacterium]